MFQFHFSSLALFVLLCNRNQLHTLIHRLLLLCLCLHIASAKNRPKTRRHRTICVHDGQKKKKILNRTRTNKKNQTNETNQKKRRIHPKPNQTKSSVFYLECYTINFNVNVCMRKRVFHFIVCNTVMLIIIIYYICAAV